MIFLNDEPVEFTRYPNGELALPRDMPWKRAIPAHVRLHWESDEDLVKLALVRGMLRQWPIAHSGYRKVILTIDYMPYSRMDREQDGHCFSLKWIASLIDKMLWDEIHVVEPHSDVVSQVFLPSVITPIWSTVRLTPIVIQEIGFDRRRDWLVFPDKGAADRYTAVFGDYISDINVIVLEKKRDFTTGKIVGLDVAHRVERHLHHPEPGAKALIIDDLCSRGGTFIQASEILRHSSLRCSEVHLLVTHMELAGIDNPSLSNMLDRVFFTDTMLSVDFALDPELTPNFRVFDRKEWM